MNGNDRHAEIMKRIREFEKALPAECDLSLVFPALGSLPYFDVDEVGFYPPDLVTFKGQAQGLPFQIVQHESQLNFLLLAQRREPDVLPKRPIGFYPPDEE